MMIAVQSIRAQAARSSSEPGMSVTDALALSMRRKFRGNDSSYISSKRKRDCWEAYDYQVQKKQKMRCSLLRETASDKYICPDGSHEQPFQVDCKVKESFMKTQPINCIQASNDRSLPTNNSNDDLQKQVRRHLHELQKREACRNTASRKLVKMTKKYCMRKRRIEMMEATSKRIQEILGQQRVVFSPRTVHNVRHLRHRAERLDSYLRSRCHSIQHKEKEIKLWLSLTTGNKRKIVKLTRKLHQRWGEVKHIQSEVKPHRLRLKNLKYAMLCEERSIAEEAEEDEFC